MNASRVIGELGGSDLIEVRLALRPETRGPSEAQRLLLRPEVVRIVAYGDGGDEASQRSAWTHRRPVQVEAQPAAYLPRELRALLIDLLMHEIDADPESRALNAGEDDGDEERYTAALQQALTEVENAR